MSRTMEQKRAAFALRRVQDFRGNAEKMATHIHNTPMRILNNGLGQALAFLQADNEGKRGNERKESGRLFDIVQEWLCGAPDEEHPARVYGDGSRNLITSLMEGRREEYMRAQEEALALFAWLRKFADAGMLGEDPDPSPEAPGALQNGQQQGEHQAQGANRQRRNRQRNRRRGGRR